MEKYKIELSSKARQDYKEIVSYLRYDLCEPNIAERYANLIKMEIQKLDEMPKKFAPIDTNIIKYNNIRKLIIKNYIAFYRVNDDTKTVNVERILYGGVNWKNI